MVWILAGCVASVGALVALWKMPWTAGPITRDGGE